MVVDRPEVRNFTEYYSLLIEFVDINLQDTNEYPEEFIFVISMARNLYIQ